MKNLKKVLALVLAFAMAFTMVISATAFTDDKAIAADNQDAVNVMTALGVLKGYTDGTFNPTGDVTRAEMAKMIYVIRSGGSDDASAYANVPTTFTDLGAASWASGYIKYCQTMGIIAGKSATQFDPNGKVTLAETAKMALVALGYKPERAGLTGAQWLNKTLSLATENDLMDSTTGAVTGAASRQEAAQVLRNMLDTDCVLWSNDKEQFVKDGNGDTTGGSWTDAGFKYMGLQRWVGSFEGNDKVLSTLDDGYIRVHGSIDGAATGANIKDADFPSKLDIKNIGEEVSVLFKDAKVSDAKNQPDKKDTIYGIYVTGGTKVYNISVADLQETDDGDGTEIKFGDKAYDVDTTQFTLNVNYGGRVEGGDANEATNKAAAKLLDKGSNSYYGKYSDTVKLIQENGKITKAYVETIKLARVTAVNSEKISINNSVGQLDIADNDIYASPAKDDIVSVQTFYKSTATTDGAYTVVKKITPIEAELKGYTLNERVRFNDSDYTVIGKGKATTFMGKLATSSIYSEFVGSDYTDGVGDTYKFYLVGKYVYAIELVEGTKNYAVVESVDGTSVNDRLDPTKVAVILADGTEKVYKVHKDSDVTAPAAGALIKFTYASDESIKITEAGSAVATVPGASVKLYDKDTKKFDGKITDSDCVMFVQKANAADAGGITDSDFYAYKIRGLSNLAYTGLNLTVSGNNVPVNAQYMYNKDGTKVVAAYMVMTGKPSGSANDTVYGIVSDKGIYAKESNGDYYTTFQVSTKDGTETVKIEGSVSKDDLTEADLIGFKKSSDNIYTLSSDIDVYHGADRTTDVNDDLKADLSRAVAIDEYDEKDQIVSYFTSVVLDGSSYKGEGTAAVDMIDDDAVVTYVDIDEASVTTGGNMEFDPVTGYMNAMVVYEMVSGSRNVLAIFVNTNADYDIAGGEDVGAQVTVNDVTIAPAALSVNVGAGPITANIDVVAQNSYAVGEELEIKLTASADLPEDKEVTVTLNDGDTDYTAKGTLDADGTVLYVTLEIEAGMQGKTLTLTTIAIEA